MTQRGAFPLSREFSLAVVSLMKFDEGADFQPREAD